MAFFFFLILFFCSILYETNQLFQLIVVLRRSLGVINWLDVELPRERERIEKGTKRSDQNGRKQCGYSSQGKKEIVS